MWEFSLTHYQTVALLLINLLHDPELIKYFIAIFKVAEIEDARAFHESMRLSKEGRWSTTKKLSKERKFHQMNSCVPITCTLPFDGGMWRNSTRLLRVIPYFRPGLIKETYIRGEELNLLGPMGIDKTIRTVNLIYDGSGYGVSFRGGISVLDIELCKDDFEKYEGDSADAPYIRVIEDDYDNFIEGLYN